MSFNRDDSRFQVLILAAAQALSQTTSVLVLTIGALAAAQVTDAPGLLTAPIAAMLFGTAVATFPASFVMARIGRRPGFILGALVGALGGVLAACGVWFHSLILLCAGTALAGANSAFAQFYRFAASEVADDAFRPRAISLVLAGGVVAAFLGPYLARSGSALLPALYAGSFLILSAVCVAAAAILIALRIPAPAAVAQAEKSRSWWQMVRQPVYLTALFGAATGAGIMMLAMTATPVAMKHHHHGLDASAMVIQLHVLGMFVPSFFTGALITRFGVLKVMTAGIVVLAAHIAMTLTGTGFASFSAALILLGIGWNFLYIGGTTLLTRAYTPAEKNRAQATNDMTVFVIGFVCSLSAGGLLQQFGWQMLNVILLPWLAVALGGLVWFAMREARTR